MRGKNAVSINTASFLYVFNIFKNFTEGFNMIKGVQTIIYERRKKRRNFCWN